MSVVMTRAALAAALALSSTAAMHAEPLTDPKGAALYLFDEDVGLSSTCYFACATKWPPYLAKTGNAMAEDWTMVARKDGTMQWSYEGRPAYRGSAEVDRTNGVGLPMNWHLLVRNNKHGLTSVQ